MPTPSRVSTTASAESVIEQAMTLTGGDRLKVAGQLLESVEPPRTAEIEVAWEKEIEKRIACVDAGATTGRSWEEIQAEFVRRYSDKR